MESYSSNEGKSVKSACYFAEQDEKGSLSPCQGISYLLITFFWVERTVAPSVCSEATRLPGPSLSYMV